MARKKHLARRLAAGLLGLLATTGSALAHAHLTTAAPAANGTVTPPPTEIALTFSEGIEPAFTGIAVSGPQGAVRTGTATVREGRTLVVPVSGPLPPGSYTVTWHALAKDGHKTEGRYSFTVAP